MVKKSSQSAKSTKPQKLPTFESLSKDWSHTDSEGYTRVVPTDGFRTGFVIMAQIGPFFEKAKYYPELTLCSDKVIIKIDDSNDQQALLLAKQVDDLLHVPDPARN